MCKRKHWGWPSIALALLALLAFVMFNTARRRISRTNYERIELGMTAVEVQDILGPPTDFDNSPRYSAMLSGAIRGRSTSEELDWIGSDVMIEVYFDETGRVAGTSLASVRLYPRTFLERMVDYLRIQK